MIKRTTLYVDWFANMTQYQFRSFSALIFQNLIYNTFGARNSLQYGANRNFLQCLHLKMSEIVCIRFQMYYQGQKFVPNMKTRKVFDARHGVKKRCQTWNRIILSLYLLFDSRSGIVF